MTLLTRLIVFNVVAFAAVAWCFMAGYGSAIFEEASYIPHAMVALFLIGLISTFIRGAKVSRLIATASEAKHIFTREKLHKIAEIAQIRQAHIYAISDWLVYAALIGTAVGILVMVPAGSSAEQMHAATSGGLRIALPATIMGFILALWTSVNFQMLDTAIRVHIVDMRR